MNAEIKAKWIAALWSGEYKQGQMALHQNGKYCCLGVLCDLHAKENEGEWEMGIRNRMSYMDCVGFPPEDVCKWAGISASPTGIAVKVDGRFTPLYHLNDNGIPFSEIANYIERGL